MAKLTNVDIESQQKTTLRGSLFLAGNLYSVFHHISDINVVEYPAVVATKNNPYEARVKPGGKVIAVCLLSGSYLIEDLANSSYVVRKLENPIQLENE